MARRPARRAVSVQQRRLSSTTVVNPEASNRGRRSEVAGRLVCRTGEFRVVQRPDLLDCHGRVVTFQISHSVGHMSSYVSQHDAPTRSIRPSLGTQRTDKFPVGDPSTQHLPRSWIGFNLGWHSEIAISVLFGFEHTQILARFRLAGVMGLGKMTRQTGPGLSHFPTTPFYDSNGSAQTEIRR
jgi:hypothetical protein